jgi:hypothetical protein
LFWLKSERADTYLIDRSLDDGHTWERLGIASELSFTAPKTPEDQVAVYRVAAQNASGTSDFSEVLRSGEVVTVTVSGHVFFLGRKERPIRQATVTLSQDGTAHQTSTNEQGYYSFQVPAGKPIEIGAALNSFSSPSRGVDVADIIGLRKHILNSSRLSDSVKWVAADANRDGSIDISDIVQMRKIILNRDDAFSRDEQGQKHSIWRLVCYDFVGLQPESAFAELSNYSVCRYEQVNADITNADFIAIKLGDSNGDWILEDTENP